MYLAFDNASVTALSSAKNEGALSEIMSPKCSYMQQHILRGQGECSRDPLLYLDFLIYCQ